MIIALDADAVYYSEEAEKVFKSQGMGACAESERAAGKKPLSGGPFKSFLAALQRLQSQLPEEDCPIRAAVVTARSAPAHERVIRTLRARNVRSDEPLLLRGLSKRAVRTAYGTDVFSRDQRQHCD